MKFFRGILSSTFLAPVLFGLGSGHAVTLSNEFFPFAMCMGGMTPQAQVDTLQRMGFGSIGLQDTALEVLRGFEKVSQVSSGKFNVRSTLWWTNVTQPKIDSASLDKFLVEAAKLKLAVWMVLDGNDQSAASRKTALGMAQQAARRCKALGVVLVIYPHGGAVISSAEQGAVLIDSLNARGATGVRLSIHLCHELKAGNAKRLDSVVAKVVKYLDFATVSGADSNTVDINDDNWASAIKPLGQGTFDPTGYVNALNRNGFTGPIELHTYNLPSPGDTGYHRHLENSLAWWKARFGPSKATGGAAERRERVPQVLVGRFHIEIVGASDHARVRLLGPDGRRTLLRSLGGARWDVPVGSARGFGIVEFTDGGISRRVPVVF